MAPENPTDTSAYLDAYLETALALVGLARLNCDSERVEEAVAKARRAHGIAGGLVSQVADSEQRQWLEEKARELATAIAQLESSGSKKTG